MLVQIDSIEGFYQKIKNIPIFHYVHETHIGRVFIITVLKKVCEMAFLKEGELESEVLKNTIFHKNNLIRSFEETSFVKDAFISFEDVPLWIRGTSFQVLIWKELLKIRKGDTVSYSEIAQKIQMSKGIRAVAKAISSNKIAYFIPCHRVIHKNGELGGYRWGIEYKKKLLSCEGACFKE